MTLVIIVAAAVAVAILIAIMALGRSPRPVDESERFRRISDLTSQWSRQQHADAASGGVAGATAAGAERAGSSVDLREPPGTPATAEATGFDRAGSTDHR